MNPQEYARMHALETQYWWFAGRRAIIASLLDSLRSRSAHGASSAEAAIRLLDIGCGTGANLPLLRSFAGSSGSVTAMDFSPLALQFARDQLPCDDSSKNLSMLRGDAQRLPFGDNSFDVATMLDVLEHLSDDCLALSEVRRVLRPGGALVMSVPAYQKLWSAHDEALHHFRRYEYHGLRRVLHGAGFSVPLLSFAMSVMPPLAWLWRRFILPFKPRRPRDAKRHSEGAILPSVPPTFNRALIRYLEVEGKLVARRPLRFGTSLVAIAIKR
ncbi:MAG TPA: methyltransferase domain-containing protein [Abditibacteriaceae bacterium]|jgi:SAM-dependent methyltransferase